MIKIELDVQNDVNNIRTSGELEDITAELVQSVSIIHDGIRKRSEDDAFVFRSMLVMAMLDPEFPLFRRMDGDASDD